MKVQVEELSPVRRRLVIEIPAEVLREGIERAYRDLQRRVRVPGFRPGKVPRPLLERRYGASVAEEASREVIGRSLRQALEEHGIQAVSEPLVERESPVGEPLRFTATVEVKPRIEALDYRELPVERGRAAVTEEEVSRELRRLQEEHAKLIVPAEGHRIEAGDFVILDYEATGEGRALSKRADLWIEVGAGRFVKEVEEALVGLCAGARGEVTVTYAPDAPNEALRGKAVRFAFEVKEVKVKAVPALDDEFARDLGQADLAALRATVQEELRRRAEERVEEEAREQLVDRLIERNPIEVPLAMVEAKLHSMLQRTDSRLRAQGYSLEQLGVDVEKMRREYEPGAARLVKADLLLEGIAAQEAVTVSAEEVEARLREIARRSNRPLEATKALYDSKGLLSSLRTELQQEKVLDFLMRSAKIKASQ
ncbi:MAG: trigger factor [Deltaproteobacteria bacterium]|nr:trigger factor [Deltaproteobacteria bacterium]